MKKVLWAVCLSALAVPSWAAPDTPSQYVPVQYVPIQYVPAQYAPAPAPSAPAAAEYETAPAARKRNLFSLGAGLVIPAGLSLNKGDIVRGADGDVKAGGPGGGIELQYLNFLNERFALGVEFGGTVLTEETENYYGYEIKTKTQTLHGMISGRLYVNPNNKNLVYVPFGVGFVQGELDGDIYIGGVKRFVLNDFSDTAPAGYIGLGVELERTEESLISLEARYHMAWFRKSGISATYSYVSIMLKAGGLF